MELSWNGFFFAINLLVMMTHLNEQKRDEKRMVIRIVVISVPFNGWLKHTKTMVKPKWEERNNRFRKFNKLLDCTWICGRWLCRSKWWPRFESTNEGTCYSQLRSFLYMCSIFVHFFFARQSKWLEKEGNRKIKTKLKSPYIYSERKW